MRGKARAGRVHSPSANGTTFAARHVEEVLVMRVIVRTVIGVIAISVGAAGAIAAFATDDIPLTLRLPLLLPFEAPAVDTVEPQRSGGFEHAPPPHRRVVVVLALAG
jgi:hypothetical protein